VAIANAIYKAAMESLSLENQSCSPTELHEMTAAIVKTVMSSARAGAVVSNHQVPSQGATRVPDMVMSFRTSASRHISGRAQRKFMERGGLGTTVTLLAPYKHSVQLEFYEQQLEELRRQVTLLLSERRLQAAAETKQAAAMLEAVQYSPVPSNNRFQVLSGADSLEGGEVPGGVRAISSPMQQPQMTPESPNLN
jgi:hypothetical protein